LPTVPPVTVLTPPVLVVVPPSVSSLEQAYRNADVTNAVAKYTYTDLLVSDPRSMLETSSCSDELPVVLASIVRGTI
jgi:hypothetical protein